MDFEKLSKSLGSACRARTVLQKVRTWNPKLLTHKDWARLAQEMSEVSPLRNGRKEIDGEVTHFLVATAKTRDEIAELLTGDLQKVLLEEKFNDLLLRMIDVCETAADYELFWLRSHPGSQLRKLCLWRMVAMSAGHDVGSFTNELSRVAVMAVLIVYDFSYILYILKISREDWLNLAVRSDPNSAAYSLAVSMLRSVADPSWWISESVCGLLELSDYRYSNFAAFVRHMQIKTASVESLMSALRENPPHRAYGILDRGSLIRVLYSSFLHHVDILQLRELIAVCRSGERDLLVANFFIYANGFADWLCLAMYGSDVLSRREMEVVLRCLHLATADIDCFRRLWPLRHLHPQLFVLLRDSAVGGWASSFEDWKLVHGIYHDAETLHLLISVASLEELTDLIRSHDSDVDSETLRSAATDELVRRLQQEAVSHSSRVKVVGGSGSAEPEGNGAPSEDAAEAKPADDDTPVGGAAAATPD
ncbi:hypothetical protein COY93_04840 [Candidatus Uhrbacteria bacterium CG_4_10_14_0_8_um_filter_58_22]|uniref:Uncharacterized protein n=1 Tax=Candidatus Uhrbacteria bacterium CG_4_10_14_0_8_um_filter_58_22 TaxID=1975029 RepID=A0A2M7Q8Q7_9BACT|nr:MAG: hypothetical protein COY93_04840 [Candidatus Uhrbacteria bacterium CG_4_10_14_0_8_um_filter_58_22]